MLNLDTDNYYGTNMTPYCEKLLTQTNILVGWQTRSQVVIGKNHPGFYTFLVELAGQDAEEKKIEE